MTVILQKVTLKKVRKMSENVDNYVDNVDYTMSRTIYWTYLSTSYSHLLKVQKCRKLANTELVNSVM